MSPKKMSERQRKPISRPPYETGAGCWWVDLGIEDYPDTSHLGFLRHVIRETEKHPKNPDARDALRLAKQCLEQSGTGYEQQVSAVSLERLWYGQLGATILAPLVLEKQRSWFAARAGGKGKAPPKWHGECIAYAENQLANGARERDLAYKCSIEFGKSDDVVRALLQANGIVKTRGK